MFKSLSLNQYQAKPGGRSGGVYVHVQTQKLENLMQREEQSSATCHQQYDSGS